MGTEQLIKDNVKLVNYVYFKLNAPSELKVRYKDDFISEGMLALTKSAKQYNENRVKPYSLFYTSIYRAMLNLQSKLYKEQRYYDTVSFDSFSLEEADEGLSINSDVLSYSTDFTSNINVEDMLSFLPFIDREVVKLRAIYGYKFSEIAQELKLSKNKVEYMYSKALDILRVKIPLKGL